ncbi:MAG: o-succinylbenzoate synthase [Saprospiraceae bacterium]
MLKATFQKYTLQFKQPSGTSRGVLRTKDSWFIFLQHSDNPAITGIGECGLLKGLSADDVPEYEVKVAEVCQTINNHAYWLSEGLRTFPSIHFGLEIALKDLANQGSKILFPSDFTAKEMPVPINGLIWMGEKKFMFDQIKTKLAAGFDCIKLKIGAIDFAAELDLLKYIRQQFSAKAIEIRVDANGAFKPTNALEKLKRLAEFDLHSIEQPIKQGQLPEMAELCEKTPLPIALDEELIGVFSSDKKRAIIETIRPQYLIFKPSFIGGYSGTQEWIDLCKKFNTPWWMTSALESNIGLNAIAQWTAVLNNPMPQGLGTGQLYTNNIESPLKVEDGGIYYSQDGQWSLSNLRN